jgi:hypothetical protein
VSLAALGAGPAIRDTERALEDLVAARRSVLILGEAGTGHDLAARSLATADAPFLVLETGARLLGNPLGLVEEARDGVLYCMEIGGTRAPSRDRVPAGQARQDGRDAHRDQRRTARQSRRQASSTRRCCRNCRRVR